MSYPKNKSRGERPKVGKIPSTPEFGPSSHPSSGPSKHDGRENLQAGTSFDDRETPFVAYWKTPARVLRHFGGND